MRGIAGTLAITNGQLHRAGDEGWTFLDRANDLACALDGSIQNAAGIRAELGLPDDMPDDEVVARAYLRFGDRLPEHLDGAFGVALWDGGRRRLLLIRDRIGLRPMFWAASERRVAFASRVGWLIDAGHVGRRLNPLWLDDYLTFGYSAHQAVVRGTEVLPPGGMLRLTASGSHVATYWRAADYAAPLPAPPDAADALRAAVAQAVREALPRDGACGLLLSGGLDSAALLALTVEAMGRPVPTFTVGFAEPTYDEREGAARVAAYYGCPNEAFVFEDHLADVTEEFFSLCDQPMVRPSFLALYVAIKIAAKSVPTALAGSGPDELLGGYDCYKAERLYRWYTGLPAGVRRELLEGAMLRLRPRAHRAGVLNSARVWAQGARRDPRIHHLRWQTLYDPAERRAMLNPEATDISAVGSAEEAMARLFDEVPGPAVHRCLYVDLVCSIPGLMARRTDMLSRAFDIDVRSPFLDRRVVELVLPWPLRLKLGLTGGKRALRAAVRRDLPPGHARHRKVGLTVPTEVYLRGPWRDWMLAKIASDRSGLFRREFVDRLVADHLAGRRDHGRRLWAVLALIQYLREHRLSP